MQETKIEWSGSTWNPVHGCSKISAGCVNCYAERISLAKGFTSLPWTKQNSHANVKLYPDRLEQPLKKKKPKIIFTCSMADLFHARVPDDFIKQVFDVMNMASQHWFVFFTKRPERLAEWSGPWSDNIIAGVSVENSDNLNRVDLLRNCGAKIKAISFEPLIGRIGSFDLSGIDWAACGGESCPDDRKRKPMMSEWAKEIRDQCVDNDVPFFFKQQDGRKQGHKPYIIEKDGSKTVWNQYPKKMRPKYVQTSIF
jgi:protein gp37